MGDYPKPKFILFDFLAIAAFLFIGLDALINLFSHYLPPISVFFSLLFGDYADFFSDLHFGLLIIIFVGAVLSTWGLIIKQVITGWTASSLAKKVMPYPHLRLLFFSIFGGLCLFFYLEAISNLTWLWLIYAALSLFVALPFALILGLFSVTVYLRQNS